MHCITICHAMRCVCLMGMLARKKMNDHRIHWWAPQVEYHIRYFFFSLSDRLFSNCTSWFLKSWKILQNPNNAAPWNTQPMALWEPILSPFHIDQTTINQINISLSEGEKKKIRRKENTKCSNASVVHEEIYQQTAKIHVMFVFAWKRRSGV